jgi:hypothetical protein
MPAKSTKPIEGKKFKLSNNYKHQYQKFAFNIIFATFLKTINYSYNYVFTTQPRSL